MCISTGVWCIMLSSMPWIKILFSTRQYTVTIFMFLILQGSGEAIDKWSEKIQYILIAFFHSYIFANTIKVGSYSSKLYEQSKCIRLRDIVENNWTMPHKHSITHQEHPFWGRAMHLPRPQLVFLCIKSQHSFQHACFVA